jgi:hypothetical protein
MENKNLDIAQERSIRLKSEFPVGSCFSSMQDCAVAFAKSAALKNIHFSINHHNKKCISLDARTRLVPLE